MHHIVARLKLTNLFERERHLGIARVVGTQIVLVETIEDLVVGVEGGSHIRVGETLVEGEVDGREKRSPRRAPLRLCQLPEDVAQTLLLLFAVGQHIDALPVGD